MKPYSTGKRIIYTLLGIVAILSFYICGGAISQIQQMDPVMTVVTHGICVWLSVAAILIFNHCKKYTIADLGLRKVKPNGMKTILYVIPMICEALAAVFASSGLQSVSFILASLFLCVAVGFSEEIYFRGLIFQFWKDRGITIAIIISSIVFGISHSANMIGGAGIYETLLQIVFAFVYGIVCALIFVLSDSLVPCISIHFLHDFISYCLMDGNLLSEIVVATIQTVIIVLYMILLMHTYRSQKK